MYNGGKVTIGNPIIGKSMICGIICLFVGVGIISNASRFDEILDQYQDNFYPGQGFEVNVNEYGKEHAVAQSFKPAMTPLTKIDLVILTSEFSTLPVIVSIRDDLEGNDLTSIITPSEQIPQDNASWHMFDFPDITVVPETTYYIVVRSNQTGFGYFIGFFNSVVDNYPRGTTWSYYDGNWTLWGEGTNYFFDCAFKTYSNIEPPTPPTISGPHYGKINTDYTFSIGTITDPEGDQLYCLWEWGDGTTSDWLGPYNSGATINASHSWSQPGTYTIKAKIKDATGLESNWSEPFVIYITSKVLLLGLVHNAVNQSEEGNIFNMSLAFIMKFKPIDLKIYSSVQVLMLMDEFHGMIGSRFFAGFVYALIL